MAFLALVNLLFLICGIVLLCLTLSWEAQRGKSLFIAFVSLTFIAIPVSQFLFYGLAIFLEESGRNSYQFARMLMTLYSAVWVVSLIAMMILLILYVVARRPGDLASHSNSKSGSFVPHKTWETQIPPRALIAILRRREWAFLIDCAPAVLTTVALFYMMTWSSYNNSGLSIAFFSLTMLIVPLLLLYIIFRDSVGGVSLGKWITGCRVVDVNSGAIPGFGICLVRNLIFLFPIMAFVELAAASFRADRRRFGDLLAGTIVVAGPPKTIDGVEQQLVDTSGEAERPPIKHALDD